MGQYPSNLSQLEKEIGSENFPANERYFGLVNFGNTCYCNSVLQALYFCKPFREKVLQYRLQSKKVKEESLLSVLADLFHNTTSQKKRVGTIAPKKFIARVKKDNAAFDNFMQQDAHEFFNFLLNSLSDILQAEKSAPHLHNQHPHHNQQQHHREVATNAAGGASATNNNVNNNSNGAVGANNNNNNNNGGGKKSTSEPAAPQLGRSWRLPPSLLDGRRSAAAAAASASPRPPSATSTTKKTTTTTTTSPPPPPPSSTTTWIHDLFQGTLTNETRCLNCETVSSKDEDFLDLSVDVEANTSISHCLRVFSNTETLCAEQKYHCEKCQSKQEAQKRMRVKKLPQILCLHLKRFKYMEDVQRYTKLSHRVVFPFELRLFNTSTEADNPDKMFDLVAVVVHCGTGPNRGHYVSLVRSHGFWLLFDDDIVDRVDVATVQDFYGVSSDDQKQSESGYILFYEAREL